MKLIRLQPAPLVDHIDDSGQEFTRLPYPFYVNEAGEIQRQDFWNGNPTKVIGFQRDLAVQTIDLWWREAYPEPTKTVGMYLVTVDSDGQWGVHSTAIASAFEFSENDN